MRNELDMREQVRKGYADIASSKGASCCSSPSCCGASVGVDDFARAIGYDDGDLSTLPEGANMGLSCGNPTALAGLNPGDIVLDLGCGGGFDVFVAARRVGPSGKAIGVDMTPEMIRKARINAAAYRERTGLDNIEFRLGEIEHLPAADNSVDVVISNCVINLSPNKPQVWREIARVLRPGGRVAVSDLALLQPLPEAVAESVEALVGCIAGAVTVAETERMIREAGLGVVCLEAKSEFMKWMSEQGGSFYHDIEDKLPAGTRLGDYVTSLNIRAVKSGGCCCR